MSSLRHTNEAALLSLSLFGFDRSTPLSHAITRLGGENERLLSFCSAAPTSLRFLFLTLAMEPIVAAVSALLVPAAVSWRADGGAAAAAGHAPPRRRR
eukprot:1314984-Pleurochrysis_carterae.AAC.1